MKKYLFVSGCARSGTSGLSGRLNKHPEIALGMERFIGFLSGTGSLRAELFESERFFDVQKGDTFYSGMDFFKGNPSREEYENAAWVGDKIPRLYNYYAEIFQEFPDAKVLFIVRNPLSVAASFEVRARDESDEFWSSKRDAYAAIRNWNESIASSLPYIKSGQVLPVSFERLFYDGKGWEQVQKFLDLAEPVKAVAPTAKHLKIDVLDPEQIEYVRENADWENYEAVLGEMQSGPSIEKYAAADLPLMDYGLKRVPGLQFSVRDASNIESIALGSAATFGRFIKKPYPEMLGMSNFGIGGARPNTFLFEPVVLSRLARAQVAVMEVTSARGYGCTYFQPSTRFNNMLRLTDAGRKTGLFDDLPEVFFVERFWNRFFANGLDRALSTVQEVQTSWVKDMKDLCRFSKRPILLWFSQHEIPDSISSKKDYFFPHFIKRDMLDEIDAELVTVASSEGIPFRLINDDCEPVPLMKGWEDPTVNSYYPSQEMHNEAAEKLRNLI